VVSISLEENTDWKAACSLHTITPPAEVLVHSQPFPADFPALENQHNMLHQCTRRKCL